MYDYKDPYIVDFREVKYYSEIHTVLRDAFDFPDYYGRNWDAFWDCLTDMLGRPYRVELYGMEHVRELFDDTAQKIIDTLREWKHFDDDLDDAPEIHIYLIEGKSETEIA